MPRVTETPSRLQSPSSWSPLSSPSSSLPSVCSPGSMNPPRGTKQNTKDRHQLEKTMHENEQQKLRKNAHHTLVSGTTKYPKATEEDIRVNHCRSLDRGIQHTQDIEKSNGDGNSSWPVLVAVRCRPRKRQRAEGRFAAALGGDEEIRRSSMLDSGYSSSDSSSEERGSNYRSSSGSVQRGVFEYSACRDYDYAATYDSTLPPLRLQRPRRLHVQAPSHTSQSASGRRSFDFDFVFPPWKKQRDVYENCVEGQIRHVLEAQQRGQQQHATVVAYGQTGTGKTYTMGMLSDFRDDKEQGLIPRALSQVLAFAAGEEADEDSLKTVVTLSFLQIYLETVQDLLALPESNASAVHAKPWRKHDSRRSCSATSSDLPVRQGRDGTFYVTGLNEYEISSVEDAHALLELAMRNRVLASTTKNKTSSRSHTLLTISIKRRRRGAKSRHSSSEDEDDNRGEGQNIDEEDDPKQASTISFVDLAGSERVDGALHFLRATRARQEQRIREAKFINRSLSALGGVIAALAQPKNGTTGSSSAHVLARLRSSLPDRLQLPTESDHNQPHIRFRDSQLTKLLQGRLMGGRGRLLLIATVDDQPKNLSETLSTLKFAAQCRRVELQPGSTLRGDRSARLRRQKSLLDQVFNDMKIMHENREAALHSEYQTRIEVLERELEAARAAAPSSLSSTDQDTPTIHLASYTALCSLVDAVCSDEDGGKTHPRITDFQSEKDVIEYVAGLYTKLKDTLLAQQQRPNQEQPGKVAPEDTQQASASKQSAAPDERATPRESIRTAAAPPVCPSSTRRSRSSIQLSPEQEAEFRAVARHLISTRALDSFVVSSSDEEA
ncbi:hypothetical protein PR003_g18611 [Phytophthora rubi]|uniref:Kinesin-like protein n=3 Tax=Phytophthora rubi TaxID=129364 RepID=A0A6A4E655_9STRA|nr:hypothetical protein PR003_g18611 [Phytophthora rubi]